MEKFACEIENMLQEKLLLYKELKKIVEQEKKDIVEMNVDSLWKRVDRKKQLTLEIVQIRGRMVSLFKEKQIPLDMEKEAFSLSQIINCLPVSAKIKSDFKKIKIQLEIAKEELTSISLENKRYTNEYLSVINGIFATITGAEKKEAYNKAGNVLTQNPRKTLIRVEV